MNIDRLKKFVGHELAFLAEKNDKASFSKKMAFETVLQAIDMPDYCVDVYRSIAENEEGENAYNFAIRDTFTHQVVFINSGYLKPAAIVARYDAYVALSQKQLAAMFAAGPESHTTAKAIDIEVMRERL